MKRKSRSPGNNLYKDKRNGNYIWRRVNQRTGRREKRSTLTGNLEIARRIANQFEDEYQQDLHGIKSYACWSQPLEPLVPEWLSSLGSVSEKTLKTKSMRIHRALKAFGLKTAAQLLNVRELDRCLDKIRKDANSDQTVKRGWQDPLKQFSKWLAGNNRYLDKDPLALWEPYKKSKESKRSKSRRAMMPDEVARAFAASRVLDSLHRKDHPQTIIYETLLVTAPRFNALKSRNIEDFDFEVPRIYFGEDVKNKRKGRGALDNKTAEELAEYIGTRERGPLFLSPKGVALRQERFLDRWREAFSLGLLSDLLPQNPRIDMTIAMLTHRALTTGEVRVSRGGNPRLVKAETLRERRRLKDLVERLCDEVRDRWQQKMTGVDVHCFRKTHRTWAEAKGVQPVLIDMQLGHALVEESTKIMRALVGSHTGRKHYLDKDFALFDAARSAEAVREMLDDATASLQLDETFLVAHEMVHERKKASA